MVTKYRGRVSALPSVAPACSRPRRHGAPRDPILWITSRPCSGTNNMSSSVLWTTWGSKGSWRLFRRLHIAHQRNLREVIHSEVPFQRLFGAVLHSLIHMKHAPQEERNALQYVTSLRARWNALPLQRVSRRG
jgi:hypothetical protein